MEFQPTKPAPINQTLETRRKISQLADEHRQKNKSKQQLPSKLMNIQNKIDAGFYDTETLKAKLINKLTEDILDNLPEDPEKD